MKKCDNCNIQIKEGTGQNIFVSDDSVIFCQKCYKKFQEEMSTLPKINSL